MAHYFLAQATPPYIKKTLKKQHSPPTKYTSNTQNCSFCESSLSPILEKWMDEKRKFGIKKIMLLSIKTVAISQIKILKQQLRQCL